MIGGFLAVQTAFSWSTRESFDPAAVVAFVLEKIDRAYVTRVDPHEITKNALIGVTEALDRWSAYIPPEEFADFDEEAEGRFGGIGIVFEHRSEGYFVKMVLTGGPADRAGVREGDQLWKADGVLLSDLNEEELRRRLRGDPGTGVRLALRNRAGEERTVRIRREIIHDPSVHRVRLLSRDPAVGYVRIERFQRDTSVELDKAMAHLTQKRLEGLVIDMRENPGGLYDEAVAVADRFLDSGVIVSTQGRGDPEKRAISAVPGNEYPPMRIVLAVNRRTASAAEIVAAALRGHRKALLVGEPTYGKFAVQTVYEIFGKGSVWGALKLTTKRYFTPQGFSYSGDGLPVDVRVEQDESTIEKLYRLWQESLRRSWNDPTRLPPETEDVSNDAPIAEALKMLRDPKRYRELLENSPRKPSTERKDGKRSE